MSVSLLNQFPENYTPNLSQVKLLTEIQQAFNDGYKFVVCSAPTGSGKSFIAKTLANDSGAPSDEFIEYITSYNAFKQNDVEPPDEKPFGTFALTITKTLQDQYKSFFDDVAVLKGKNNYQCAVDTDYTVDVAPCVLTKSIKNDCWKSNICPYYNSRNEALTRSFSTLNYNMFFSLPDNVKRRKYIICDEAAELEDQLVKQYTCFIKYDVLKKYGIVIPPFNNKNYATVQRWLSVINTRILDKVTDVLEAMKKQKKKVRESLKIEYIILSNLNSKIQTLLDTWEVSEYLYEGTCEGINFIPLRVDGIAKHIFDHGDKIILMSATIIDPKNFCKMLGIDKFKYIEVPSVFDPKNAPIHVNTKTRLSFNNLERTLPVIKQQIESICKHHGNVKGLIHTHTNSITAYLKKNLKGSRFLYREMGVNNEALLEEHYNTNNPTVLVSPSLSHGVDLKDDLARFQIIVKAPYLPMKDKRVECIMKTDKDWYINKMLASLIQACGRGVRSIDDHCVTYILDGSIIDRVISHKDKIPKYFLDRFV